MLDERQRAFAKPACFTVRGQGFAGARALEAYRRDGVVCFRQAFGPAWLQVIESGIAQAVAGAAVDASEFIRTGDKGSFFAASQMWRMVEPFRRFIFESGAADLFWPLLDSKDLTLFYDFLLIKQPFSDNAATPWHQDHSFYPLSGSKAINCWIALDPIPAQSALRFVRGSHRAGTLYRAISFEPGIEYPHAQMERPLPPDADADPHAEILSCALEPGDTLVWNSHTLHGAPGNRLTTRRAAYSVNWVGDDVTFNDIPSIETYRHPSLVHGRPIGGAGFPVVRTRA